MAILKQVVFFATVLCATGASYEKSENPIPSGGPSFAQASVKQSGAALLSEATKSGTMDRFASLDDIFDAETKDIQAEPSELSVKEVLTSPSLYFTVALVLGAGLLLTSKNDAQPQCNISEQRKEKEEKIRQDKAAPAPQAAAATAAADDDAAAVKPTAATVEMEANMPTADQQQALLAAADACKAGQAGSYENFCKLLAATSTAQ